MNKQGANFLVVHIKKSPTNFYPPLSAGNYEKKVLGGVRFLVENTRYYFYESQYLPKWQNITLLVHCFEAAVASSY